MDRKAKIVATLGPSSQDPNMIGKLIDAGMSVARLNFSHGTHEQHAQFIADLRKLSDEKKRPVTILQDLQGPKLRVGEIPGNGVKLTARQKVVLTAEGRLQSHVSNKDELYIPMDVPDLVRSVVPGNRILMDDGHLELVVTDVREDAVEATVVLGGLLKSHKGVNLPGANLNVPGFTEKDREDLAFGLAHGVDAVAISFVRTGTDVEMVRQAIRELAPKQADTPIIAKLERPEAIEHLDEILLAADGVMVARGDLGVETSPAQVPIMQKEIIKAANRSQKVVITATQMLDSMIHNPRPTRAEASDVANAIFDGTDAVMLSGETASGEYPLESVEMMAMIVREAEAHPGDWSYCMTTTDPTEDDALSLTRAARELAHDRDVEYIAVFTQSGRTAILMSKARPQVPILALTPEPRVYQRLNLCWGVTPVLVPYSYTVEMMISSVEDGIRALNPSPDGEQVIIITAFPVGAWRPANFLLLHTIGEQDYTR